MANYVSGSDLRNYLRWAGMGEKGNLDPVDPQKMIPRDKGAGTQGEN